jgi:hypothetical protein
MFRSAVPSVFLSELWIRPGVVPASRGGGDPGGGADRDRAGLGAQHDRAAHGLGDLEVALAGADLRVAAQAADRDVAGQDGKAGARGLVNPDRGLRGFEGDVAKPSHGAELGAGYLRLDPGACRQLDRDLDGSGASEDPVLHRGLDPQHTECLAPATVFVDRCYAAVDGGVPGAGLG